MVLVANPQAPQLYSFSHNYERTTPHGLRRLISGKRPGGEEEYEPLKVFSRDEFVFSSREPKAILAEKVERRQTVKRVGFCSDSREPYTCLGTPIINTDTLILSVLGLDATNSKKQVALDPVNSDATLDDRRIKLNMNPAGSLSRTRNGSHLIKEKIAESELRIRSVKGGASVLSAVQPVASDGIEAGKGMVSGTLNADNTMTQNSDTDLYEFKYDYTDTRIDLEKRNFYTRLLQKNKSLEPENTQTSIDDSGSNENQKRKLHEKNFTDITSRPGTADAKSEAFPSIPRARTGAMLESLRLRKGTILDPVNQFFAVRDEFYEQRTQLTEYLSSELSRNEQERVANVARKAQAFVVGANPKLLDFKTDMSLMRARVREQQILDRVRHIKSHAWYEELIASVTAAAVNRDLSDQEFKLLRRIKTFIEDGEHFTKSTLATLIKSVPQVDFGKDNLQRIFKFLKKSVYNMSDREFQDIAESCGYFFWDPEAEARFMNILTGGNGDLTKYKIPTGTKGIKMGPMRMSLNSLRTVSTAAV